MKRARAIEYGEELESDMVGTSESFPICVQNAGKHRPQDPPKKAQLKNNIKRAGSSCRSSQDDKDTFFLVLYGSVKKMLWL